MRERGTRVPVATERRKATYVCWLCLREQEYNYHRGKPEVCGKCQESRDAAAAAFEELVATVGLGASIEEVDALFTDD